MLSSLQAARVTAFRVVGFKEVEQGVLDGPHLIRNVDSIGHARELCAAVLWFEADQWVAVAIMDLTWHEVARFRRFPPGRKRPEYASGNEVVWGEKLGATKQRGARLADRGKGGRRKSFGGDTSGRSGFEGI